jgi:CHAD domain-containing protein
LITSSTTSGDPGARGEPVQHAAERLLGKGLRRVEKTSRRASESGREEPEAVHQLRVSTRRAAAALRLFGPWLDAKPAKKARRTLSALRRGAGVARAADVMLERVERLYDEALDHPQREGWAFVAGRLTQVRERGLDEVEAALQSIDRETLRGRRERVMGSLASSPRGDDADGVQTFGELAERAVASCEAAIAAAAGAGLDEIENLHQLRIEGKRLRYTLELVAPCLGENVVAARLATLEAMQDRLGAINDLGDLAATIEAARADAADAPASLRAALDACAASVRTRTDVARVAFLEWWEGPGAAAVLGTGAVGDRAAGSPSLERDLDAALTAARSDLNGASH